MISGCMPSCLNTPTEPIMTDIKPATVTRVIKMRQKGLTWSEIIDTLKVPRSFILRVRPLMKKVDKKSVRRRASA